MWYSLAKDNLATNGFKSNILIDGFHKISEISCKYNGIVTYLPYGRNSKIAKTPKNTLRDFLIVIPKKKRFAIMFKKELGDELKLNGLKKYQIYRHKSLTSIILMKWS